MLWNGCVHPGPSGVTPPLLRFSLILRGPSRHSWGRWGHLSAMNVLSFFQASSPACTELEMNVMDWLAKMLGLPEYFLHHHPSSQGGGVLQVPVMTTFHFTQSHDDLRKQRRILPHNSPVLHRCPYVTTVTATTSCPVSVAVTSATATTPPSAASSFMPLSSPHSLI